MIISYKWCYLLNITTTQVVRTATDELSMVQLKDWMWTQTLSPLKKTVENVYKMVTGRKPQIIYLVTLF